MLPDVQPMAHHTLVALDMHGILGVDME